MPKEFLEHLRLAGSSAADEWARVRDLVVVEVIPASGLSPSGNPHTGPSLEAFLEVPSAPCRRCGQHLEGSSLCSCPGNAAIAWGLHDAADTAWVATLRSLQDAFSHP